MQQGQIHATGEIIEAAENQQLGQVFLSEVVSPVSEHIFVHLARVLNI